MTQKNNDIFGIVNSIFDQSELDTAVSDAINENIGDKLDSSKRSYIGSLFA